MNVRFLLACDTFPPNPWYRDRLPAIREASDGFDFDIMDIYEFNSRVEAHKIHELKGVGFFTKKNMDLHDLNQKFYNRVMSHDCNILILGTIDNYAWFLLPETVKKLQKDGIFVVGILGDDEFTYKRNQLYVPMFDKVIVYVRKYVDYYNAIKPGASYYLPNSCYFPNHDFSKLQIDEKKKKFDVTLMGAPSGVRPRLVRALIDAGINVALFGSSSWQEYGDLRAYYHGYVSSEDTGTMIQASKIIIAAMEDHLTGALHMNTKIWDAVKYGQMCIATRYLPLVEDYGFVENEDIVMYASTEDLVDKVRYYLVSPRERRRIAENLFHKVKEKLDYVYLYNNLFLDLEQEYHRAHDQCIAKCISPKVTIVDLSESGKSHTGFNQWNSLRRKGWQERLRKEYPEVITTPFVILTYGGCEYAPYLNQVVELYPDSFNKCKSILKVITNQWQERSNIIDINTIVWGKEAFFEQYLTKWSQPRYFYKKGFSYSFGNLRLCNMSEARLVYRAATFIERCVRTVNKRVTLLIKRMMSFRTEHGRLL